MKQIRVAHYNHTETVAGAERVLLDLLPRLRDVGVQSVLLCPPGQLQKEAERLGIETRASDSLQARFTWNPLVLLKYVGSIFSTIRNIRRLLRDLKPDIIHANSVRAGLVATGATVGLELPVLWHVHDTLPAHPFSPFIRMIAALSPRTSFVVVSHATSSTFAGKIAKRWIAPKTVVLHNAVTHPSTRISPDERSAIRESLGVGERFLIGCIGQICPRKNQLGMLEIFAEVQRSRPDIVLFIVGSAIFPHNKPYEQQLSKRLRELGINKNVHLLGQRSDVRVLLEAMDLLVVPSLSEPFPMIILESMSAGLPVVAHSVDGIPELIADGRTGWLVPPKEPRQMVSTILFAEQNPSQRSRIAQAASRAIRAHSPSVYAEKFGNILRSRTTCYKEFEPLGS